MILKKWDKLPLEMQTNEVKVYYDILKKKRLSMLLMRIFDVFVSAIMLILLIPAFGVMAVLIKLDSRGPVFFRQVRITQYNKKFRIYKFRSMVQDAEKGAQVTVCGDTRITRIGKVIRKYRLDEISQLIDVLRGTMTFVGTRPESEKYVKAYTPEMMATLLLPAGITSLASIYFKDESELLENATDVDKEYIERILPQKMKYNLEAIKNFSFLGNIRIMAMTVIAVLGKNYKDECKKV